VFYQVRLRRTTITFRTCGSAEVIIVKRTFEYKEVTRPILAWVQQIEISGGPPPEFGIVYSKPAVRPRKREAKNQSAALQIHCEKAERRRGSWSYDAWFQKNSAEWNKT